MSPGVPFRRKKQEAIGKTNARRRRDAGQKKDMRRRSGARRKQDATKPEQNRRAGEQLREMGEWKSQAPPCSDVGLPEDDGLPVDLPVLDYPDDLDDQLTAISQETLQDVLGTLQTPPPVTRRSIIVAAILEDPPTTPKVVPASSNTAEDSDDTGTTFERTVVGVQRELAKEVRVGMQTMAASLERMPMCMMTSAEQTAAKQVTQSLLHGVQQRVRDLTTVVRELPQHLPSQSCCCMHDNKQDSVHWEMASLKAYMDAYHRDVSAIVNYQQLLLAPPCCSGAICSSTDGSCQEFGVHFSNH
ncbi:hypothetical protein NDU88_002707 [Pleurodeles waltl]|uniref:Uncharacterized protein n=1 Tax=Pleurodeles waltl TaxID=8319 RepID=A0AAV7VC30_PLEWA|nr:hypothetical protein NDU88_002707 [Pleurodeles waltl]